MTIRLAINLLGTKFLQQSTYIFFIEKNTYHSDTVYYEQKRI